MPGGCEPSSGVSPASFANSSNSGVVQISFAECSTIGANAASAAVRRGKARVYHEVHIQMRCYTVSHLKISDERVEHTGDVAKLRRSKFAANGLSSIRTNDVGANHRRSERSLIRIARNTAMYDPIALIGKSPFDVGTASKALTSLFLVDPVPWISEAVIIVPEHFPFEERDSVCRLGSLK